MFNEIMIVDYVNILSFTMFFDVDFFKNNY